MPGTRPPKEEFRAPTQCLTWIRSGALQRHRLAAVYAAWRMAWSREPKTQKGAAK
jgi:hypothetical protein